MHKHSHDCLSYIADLAGVSHSLSAAQQGFIFLHKIMRELGVVESEHKATQPCQRMVWIGIEFDSLLMQISMPKTKIDDTLSLCSTWQFRTQATRSHLQQLLGKLFHIAQCCKPARLFVSRMLDTLRAAPATGHIPLDAAFKKDLDWFLSFLPLYNGIHLIQPEPDLQLEVDSCLTGCGGIYGHELYHTTFPSFVIERNHNISQLEMLNLAIAIKLWSSAAWTNHRVVVYCDNAATISILQTGRGRDPFMLACARQIWHYSARFDFQLVPRHCPGTEMTAADALSRHHLGGPHLARVQHLLQSGYHQLDINPYLFHVAK